MRFLFFIVRRLWPNCVCKGRHTSFVVLYYCIVITLVVITVLKGYY